MISLSGLDMPWLDPAKRTRGRERVVLPDRGSPLRRSDFPCPRVLAGAVEIQSKADGKTYTCRKAYRDSLKQQGMVELGNDKVSSQEQAQAITEGDVALAYEQCEQGGGYKAPENLPEGQSFDINDHREAANG